MRNGATIYFVRHGQTDWNAEVRMQGQRDTPLNDTGRSQARRNGRVLLETLDEPERFDFVASPLLRTAETMELVRSELGLPVDGYRTDPLLKEINFGDWQGHTWDELRAVMPEVVEARFADPWNTVAPGPGGESYAMLSERARAWIETVEQDTVVVSHGGINRCLRGLVEGLDVQEIPLLKVPQDKVLVIQGGATRWI